MSQQVRHKHSAGDTVGDAKQLCQRIADGVGEQSPGDTDGKSAVYGAVIQRIAVIGGQITVAVGEQLQLPVKYVMPNGTLVNPDYSDLTYTSGADATATVSATGLVEGVAVGTTDITVALVDPALTCIVPVNVVAS